MLNAVRLNSRFAGLHVREERIFLNASTPYMTLRPSVTCLFTPGLLATLLLTVAFLPILAAAGRAVSPDAQAQSSYPVRLEAKTAAYLAPSHDRFGTTCDGIADHTDASQQPI